MQRRNGDKHVRRKSGSRNGGEQRDWQGNRIDPGGIRGGCYCELQRLGGKSGPGKGRN